MIPVPGFHIGGHKPKANASLRLAGLADGKHYVQGDQIEGELSIIPEEDILLNRITFELAFIIRGGGMTATMNTETYSLSVPEMLEKRQVYKFPVQVPYHFSRPSFFGKFLNSFWELKVSLDYGPGQDNQSFVKRVLNVTSLGQRDSTSFKILVKHGKGTYQATKRELPIGFFDTFPLPSMNTISWTLPFLFSLAFLIVDGRINLDYLQVILLSLLVVATVWLVFRLNIFQMTPMELLPFRDGELRLRILDRGNDQMKKAIVGYRLLEYYLSISEGKETQKKEIHIENTFPLSEVARQEDCFYKAVLPWPEIDLPLTGGDKGLGYEWEVFIQVPNPLTGGLHEKSWPIKVGWEQFRLTPPTAEELEQEGLEVLKLKELEHLPRT